MTVLMYSDLFKPDMINQPLVRVSTVEGEFNQIHIAWPAQVGASGYNVYGSYSPMFKTNMLTKGGPITNNFYDITVAINVNDVSPYFWITKIVNGIETYISDQGTSTIDKDVIAETPLGADTQDLYIYDDEQMRFTIEEMRRRAIAILENNGEEFDLYMKMWYGPPCTCTSEDLGLDPNFQGTTNHELCFGTGIIGGYYPKITIKGIFLSSMTQIQMRDAGIMVNLKADFLSLWAPRVRRYDVAVRKLTGERYILTDVNPRDVFRGAATEQLATWQILEPTNIAYKITNERIFDNYSKIGTYNYARWDFDNYDWNIFM